MGEKNGIKKILEKVRNLYNSGFFYIFGATVINSLVSFVYSIFIVRVLSKAEYGIFSYIQNITNFGALFCSLGVNYGVLQFCSENTSIQKKYSYSRYAVHIGSLCSVLVIILMLGYTRVDRANIANLTWYVLEFSFFPVLYFVKEWITSNLRWQLKNKEYSKVLNIHSVANAVLAVVGAVLGGIHGVILGICLAYVCSIVMGLYYLNDGTLGFIKNAENLDKQEADKFLKYSVVMCIVNALISVLYTVDIFVIGNVMKNSEEMAMYKTASMIPFALNMVPNSIMTFVYPHIARNKENQEWMKKNIRRLYAANSSLNSCIGVILYIMAPYLINILFGKRYQGILPVFRILMISYILSSCLRTPAANLFGILKKTKTALLISVSTVVINVCMSITLVTRFGIMGAAWGSVCTFGIVGIISTGILVKDIYL